MSKPNKPKVIAKAKATAKVVADPASLVKCEVGLDMGEWIAPSSCQVFYIDEKDRFPDIDFEFKCDVQGEFDWTWEIKWIAKSCAQALGKNRFAPKGGIVQFVDKGAFRSANKKWRASFGGKVLGGELIVTAKGEGCTFKRRVFVLAKNPTKEDVIAELDTYALKYSREVRLAKKIFKQESGYRQHYSDGMPLVSFDKGFGLGQATNPPPKYEQAWSWKKHVEYIVTVVLPQKIAMAKSYLERNPYTDEHLDSEVLVYYNGANRHYYVWSDSSKSWIVNENVLCDPNESNKGWDSNTETNKNKTLEDLRSGKGDKPIYTGKCYAEHIKSAA